MHVVDDLLVFGFALLLLSFSFMIGWAAGVLGDLEGTGGLALAGSGFGVGSSGMGRILIENKSPTHLSLVVTLPRAVHKLTYAQINYYLSK